MNSLLNNELTIRRYDNRKMYSPDLKRYMNYDEISKSIIEGVSVKFIKSSRHSNDEDITQEVLNLLVSEKVKEFKMTSSEAVKLLKMLFDKWKIQIVLLFGFYYIC